MKNAIEFIGNFFQNNGHLRGALYFSIAALTPMAASFTEWSSEDGPKNWYEVVALVIGSWAAVLADYGFVKITQSIITIECFLVLILRN